MARVLHLYTGEVMRMRRYGITAASFVTALLWILIIQFAGVDEITLLFPLVLFIDATLMSLLLVGVTMIFERQENALKALLVLPISKGDYLLAKSLAVVTSALVTLCLLLIYGLLFKGLTVHIAGIVAAVALIALAFAQIGIVMTYYARDFADLLAGMFKFTLLFALPTILEAFQIIKADWLQTVQYLNPTKNALVLLQAAVGQVDRADLVIAVIYMVLLAAALHIVVHRRFDRYAAGAGGL